MIFDHEHKMHKGCDHTRDFDWTIVLGRCRKRPESNAHFGRNKPEDNSNELSITRLIVIALDYRRPQREQRIRANRVNSGLPTACGAG